MAQPIMAAGQPILVVSATASPFTQYYAEILRTEGLNTFDSADIATVSASTLANYKLVMLGQTSLTAAQVTMFTNWVQSGGKLIAMRPDKQLAALLGLTDAGTTLAEGYLLVNTASAPGAGIVSQTIQFHGTADRYTLNGATAIATLYSNATTATVNPAVTLRAVGTSGGETAAFTYDLSRSVVYTRQGNPAWSGQERDGISPIRSDDLFFGPASLDPQPNWVDQNKVAIPQADEQQRLLANLVLHMNRDRTPLPRLWYFPFFKKAVIVMTGDDHANGGTAGRFDRFKALSPAGCSVANWDCVRGTSYVYPNSPLTNAQAAAYTAEGFEVGLHVNPNCADWTPVSLPNFYTTQLNSWRAQYSSIPSPSTNRVHCLVWSDYDTQPTVEFNNGMRLDANYYYWPPGWFSAIPGLFTGSGLPMRFVKANGAIVDVYQVTTQMTDESGQTYPAFVNTLLDNAVGSPGYYGAFAVNAHTDSNGGASSQMADQVVASAQARSVPVVSSQQMLQWMDARNASSFTNLTWNGSTLSFGVAGTANGLRALLPVSFASNGLSTLTRDGTAVAYSVEVVKGIAYAIFPATAGLYQATFASSTVAVSVSPASVNLGAGQSQQFTALVTGTGNTAVIWSINPATGTISSTGLYTAPAGAVPAQTVNVIATSVADPSKSGSGTVQLAGAAPIINSVTSVPSGGTAAISWITDVASDSVVNYGTAPNQLTQQASVAALVTSHSVNLAGLTIGSRYYYRVTSTGSAGNSATWPPTANLAASFLAVATSSVWSTAIIPATLDSGDNGSVELGFKVRANVNGFVTGIRFYKAAANTGTHTGNLWSSTGTSLARVTFASETASGWQEASFSSPVAVTANTTYVLSYFAPVGRYSHNNNYFASAVVNGPLRALANGEDGGNGVYLYSSATAFPNQTYLSTNYWVDVLFATSLGPDTTPPVISAVAATPGATTATITWTTDEASDTTVQYGTSAGSLGSTATGAAGTTNHSVTLTGLAQGTTYYYRVSSRDAAGNLATSPSGATPASFATTAPDTTPPVISGVLAAPGNTQASITWTTNELSDSNVSFGTAPGSLLQSATVGTLVTSHSVTLTGLTPGGTYYYRVSSTDASGNAATSPVPPAQPLSFTTNTNASIWNDQTLPAVQSDGDTGSVELGLKFRSDVSGYVTGVRFFKGVANTGSHTGALWTSTGTQLATLTFAGETASGWQQASFASPVPISANTTYVVSYHAANGRYATTNGYFGTAGFDNAPLHAPSSASSGGNGVYRYGAVAFPNQTFNATNYWVDAVFTTTAPGGDSTPPVISNVTAAPNPTTANIAWNTNEFSTTRVDYGTASGSLTLNATSGTLVSAHQIVLSGLTAGVTYYYRVTSVDGAGNSSTFPASADPPLSFTTSTTASIWSSATVPAVVSDSDTGSVELGLKFQSTVGGQVIGIRFYKGAANTGSHAGNLWSVTGTLLATVNFTNETASGWQQANFAAPVTIAANTTYVVSYHAPAGRYSVDNDYFAAAGVQNGSLVALQSGVSGGNGVYRYGAAAFPNQSYRDSNYWVDVVFQ